MSKAFCKIEINGITSELSYSDVSKLRRLLVDMAAEDTRRLDYAISRDCTDYAVSSIQEDLEFYRRIFEALAAFDTVEF